MLYQNYVGVGSVGGIIYNHDRVCCNRLRVVTSGFRINTWRRRAIQPGASPSRCAIPLVVHQLFVFNNRYIVPSTRILRPRFPQRLLPSRSFVICRCCVGKLIATLSFEGKQYFLHFYPIFVLFSITQTGCNAEWFLFFIICKILF